MSVIHSTTLHPKAYWVAFNKVAGIGPTRLTALLHICGSIEAAWRASIHQLQEAGLDKRTQANLLQARRELDLAQEWQRVERAEVHVLTWDDPDYPANLREVEAPPPVLYVRGHILEQDLLAVALVICGVPMTLSAPVEITTLEGSRQLLMRGPIALFEAIKQLGVNGGGFFMANKFCRK